MFPLLINDNKITIRDQSMDDKTLKFIDSISLIARGKKRNIKQTFAMLLKGMPMRRKKKEKEKQVKSIQNTYLERLPNSPILGLWFAKKSNGLQLVRSSHSAGILMI